MEPEGASRGYNAFRIAAGIVLVASGATVGGYFGVWWAMIRGIFRGLSLIHHTPVPKDALALDVLRLGSAGVIGWGGANVMLLGVRCLLPYHRRTRSHGAQQPPNES